MGDCFHAYVEYEVAINRVLMKQTPNTVLTTGAVASVGCFCMFTHHCCCLLCSTPWFHAVTPQGSLAKVAFFCSLF